MIKREFYLKQIIRHMHNGEIKVITGIRRCGKSVLLFELFRDYLLEQGVAEEQIITIALDQRKYYKFRNPITLCEYVESIVTADKTKQFYLFIDEVQFTKTVKDTENDDIEVSIYDMLNELKAYKNLDVYVTGSNSKMLSSDIATEFRGRATQIRVFPFSFGEFYSYIGGDERKALSSICSTAVCPASYKWQTTRIKRTICPIFTPSCMSRTSWSETVLSGKIF